jgi:hypothetical protein
VILDDEVKKRVRTLGDYVERCRELSAAEIVHAVAGGFFVCQPESALHFPDGPQPTLRVDVRLIEAVREGRLSGSCPVWPLRRRESSVYSFLSVGRTQNCDVWIPDESVSKLHALVRVQDGVFHILDAGSRNQTFVEQEPVPRRGEGDPRRLTSGASVRFGSVEIVFLTAEGFRAAVLDASDHDERVSAARRT